MIIELFGPPAVGKTTLANALAVALRMKGCEVQLAASSRPAERAPDTHEHAAKTQRRLLMLSDPLARAVKLANALPVLFSGEIKDATGAALLELLPPQSLLGRVRLRRYLSLLCQSWTLSRTYRGITIIDQGYVSALCSLAVRTRSLNAQTLARGLELVPQPDLLICLDAPGDILRARRSGRLSRQSTVERMFEQDLEMNQRQVEMVRTVAGMIRERGWHAIGANCLDESGLDNAVEKIILEIAAQRQAA
jgi:thymidylate kinase